MAKYFINSETLTDIANAIKEKTKNQTDMYPGDMPSKIRSIQTISSDTTGIPDYVITESKRVANNMVSRRGANSITAVIMSDMHEYGDHDLDNNSNFTTDAQRQAYIEKYRRANLNAGQGARVVADNIDIDFFANLGDLAWGAKTSTVTDFVQSIVNARKYTYDVEKNRESFFTPGNHDTATYGYAQNGEYLSQGVTNGLIGTYRYVDFTAKKVRVICLNTAEVEGLTVSGQSGTERMTGTQLQWFADSLDLSAKSDAANWGIVILSHHPLDWGSILPAANCLYSYLTGANYSVTHNGVAVSKNFSGKNAAKIICQFHGHVHGFRVDNIRYGSVGNLKTMDVKRIAIPNACFGRNNEYGENTGVDSNGIEFGEETSYDKVDGTAQNTAFCLVSIDLDKEVIYADCYGAGYDRVISYAEEVIVTYTITNNLTNATTSNSTSNVIDGSTYSASIIANSGYEVSSIKVTMGGIDITSSAVNGNNINIANVTGNIVITATTIVDENPETGTYANLVPTAIADDTGAIYNSPYGYKDGYYLSSASVNTYSVDANCVATGSILIGNDVEAIYVRGATWDTSNSHVRFSAGAVVGGISYNIYANGQGSDGTFNHFFTIETLGDNYYKFTFNDTAKTYLYGKYYRFSLVGTGKNLIITHNQPIPQDAEGGQTATTYSVTNNLSNIINSNAITTVISGTSYNATLSAANGYTLDGGTVQITMVENGAVNDITSSVYDNGSINIPNVTGNIVITASAKQEETGVTYTNLVPTATDLSNPGGTIFNGIGYMNGKYLSTAAPYYNTDSTTVTTGFIPYTANTQKPIYIKGVTYNTGSHDRFGYHDTNYTGVRSTPKFSETAFKDCFSVTQLDTNYFMFTPKDTSTINNKFPRMTHIAFSFTGTGDNLIITVGEPIE